MSIHDELMADAAELVHETLSDADIVRYADDGPEKALPAIVGGIEVVERADPFGRTEKVRRMESTRIVLNGVSPEDVFLQRAIVVKCYGERPFSVHRVELAGTTGVVVHLDRPLLNRQQRQGAESRRN
ncbi:MAG: hypothetical protein AAGF31_12955 [Planctomycetota bacterium]